MSDGGPYAQPRSISSSLTFDASAYALLRKKYTLIGELCGKREGDKCGVTIFLKPRIASPKNIVRKELAKGFKTVR